MPGCRPDRRASFSIESAASAVRIMLGVNVFVRPKGQVRSKQDSESFGGMSSIVHLWRICYKNQPQGGRHSLSSLQLPRFGGRRPWIRWSRSLSVLLFGRHAFQSHQDEEREGAGPAAERFLTFHHVHGCNPGACVFGEFIFQTTPGRRCRMLAPENDRRIIRKKITARRPSPTCRDF